MACSGETLAHIGHFRTPFAAPVEAEVVQNQSTIESEMEDYQFRRLLEYLGLSWHGYRKVRKGVKRRIGRHMQQRGCRKLEDYLLALDVDEAVRAQFECLMAVSISRFFRDRLLWQTLEDHILPHLIEKNKETIKVWSAGCGCGEEVYSLRILWNILEIRNRSIPALHVLATDLNPLFLDKAANGRYSLSSLREVAEDTRSAYFVPLEGGKRLEVTQSIRTGISWRVHNLLDDPPETSFQLILLRNNLLTYYVPEKTEAAFRNVVECLLHGGFLVIGAHEKIPFETNILIPFTGCPYIFQRRNTVR